MSLRDLYCPLSLQILSSRGQEQLLVCSMLLQHIVPVLIISPYPFNGKQKCGELACVISAGDVEPRLAMSSQGDLRQGCFMVVWVRTDGRLSGGAAGEQGGTEKMYRRRNEPA